MIDSLLAEISDRGYELHYLRGRLGHWEALVRIFLSSEPLAYDIGYGQGDSPVSALDSALEALASNPQTEFPILAQPTCAPAPALNSILSHLQPAPAITFRIKL